MKVLEVAVFLAILMPLKATLMGFEAVVSAAVLCSLIVVALTEEQVMVVLPVPTTTCLQFEPAAEVSSIQGPAKPGRVTETKPLAVSVCVMSKLNM